MRYLLRYTLLPLLAAILTVPVLAQQRRAWWYPLGNDEGTRRLLIPTTSQTEKDIWIKWRTTALSNSPVLLAGSLEGGDRQQIVGMSNNILTILSDSGTVNATRDYAPYVQSNRAMLTGLFDTTAVTTEVWQRPSLIGIGVEGVPSGDSLFAYLASRERGIPRYSLSLFVPNDAQPGNRWARLQPIAAFKPYNPDGTQRRSMALAIASMDKFQYNGVMPSNGLRRYSFVNAAEPSTVLNWAYDVAPALPSQPPALSTTPLTGANGPAFIGLNTSNYAFHQRRTPPAGGETWSDTNYSIALGLNDDARPTYISTEEMPPSPGPTGENHAVAHTYIATLVRLINGAPVPLKHRIITENHDAARPGEARISLAVAESSSARQGFFVDPDAEARFRATNVAWSIVTADVDGQAPAGEFQTNNRGDEIIAAWSSLDGRDLETSWLYVLGTSLLAPGNSPLEVIARQRIRGRLMAAGDLIADSLGRNEIVTVDRDTLFILQLEDYNNSGFDPRADAEARRPFRVVKSFTLDAPIVSVALADIEGDNENDIIVSTETATYAIGIPRPDPFGVIAPGRSRICSGEPLTVNWGRWIGSPADEVKLTLSREGGSEMIPVPATRPVTAPGTLTFPTDGVPAGRYRVLVQDFSAPQVADSSAEIVIDPHEITGLRVTDARPVFALGDSVHLTGTANCFNGEARIVRQVGSTGLWDTIPAIYPKNGSTYGASFELRCPEKPSCTPLPTETFRFRFVSSDGTLESDTVEVRVENLTKTLVVTPSDSSSSRRRVVGWTPAEYGCDSLSIVMLHDGVSTEIAVVPVSLGSFAFDVRDVAGGEDLTGSVVLCAHCSAGADLLCATGRGEFDILPLREAFVAPNPFDPSRGGNDISGAGALITFMLDEPATVSVTIYDPSRAVVRHLAEGIEAKGGPNYLNWDGRNSRGEIVANGAYICVVELDSHEPIILPIVVVKR